MSTNWSDLTWLNPPVSASAGENGALVAVSGDKTDFWQVTHYGFQNDNGHALLADAVGEFSAVLEFDGAYESLYDQAGLLLRRDAHNWVKFGVELTDGTTHLSVVVTRQARSDWSAKIIKLDGPIRIRATRLGDAIILQRQMSDDHWAMIRLLPDIAEGAPLTADLICAHPNEPGSQQGFSTSGLQRRK